MKVPIMKSALISRYVYVMLTLIKNIPTLLYRIEYFPLGVNIRLPTTFSGLDRQRRLNLDNQIGGAGLGSHPLKFFFFFFLRVHHKASLLHGEVLPTCSYYTTTFCVLLFLPSFDNAPPPHKDWEGGFV